MKDNLANRLAAGGFWAIQIAQLSVEVAKFVREQGQVVPLGDGSDLDVFMMCGVEAFKVVCNAHLDNAQIVLKEDTPDKYDRDGRRIPQHVWAKLVKNVRYRTIGMWHSHSGDVSVATVWLGFDKNGCEPPHLFQTWVVRNHAGFPTIEHKFYEHSAPEAAMAHRAVVGKVKRGEL